MIDINCQHSFAEALESGTVADELIILWLEEPRDEADLTACRLLTEHLNIPIRSRRNT